MHDENKHEGAEPGYETRDVPPSLVFWSLTVLGVFTVIATILVLGMFMLLRERTDMVSPQPSPFADERVLPPAPRLQALPPLDLAKYNAEMNEKLNSYGWVNKAAGTAHIPVDVALDIIAERGLPYGREHHQPKPKPVPPAPGSAENPTGGGISP